MKLFLGYLYRYRRAAALLLPFAGVTAAVLFLYGVPLEPLVYAALLCGTILLAFLFTDFFFYRRRMRLYRDVSANLPLMTEELPPLKDPECEALRQMILRLAETSRESLSRLSAARRESVEYYTVWLHQIKTPIAAMRMILQAEDTETNRELSDELFRIEQYAQMALNYLRLESPSSDLRIERVPLDRIIKRAVRQYAPLFVRRRIRLIYEETDARVLTDEKWLLFLLEQLLSNAVKYTGSGSVTIRFGENEVLTISDTGIGIAAEDLPRVFEKGFTGLSGRANRKSTGLGLYLCKRTADKLGHRLSISSRVGAGTAVSVDLHSADLAIE